MRSVKFTKKIKNFAIASFLIPLIAVNSCFLIYKYFGHLSETYYAWPNFNWNIEKIEHTYNDYILINENKGDYTYTNCPKHKFKIYFITDSNKSIENKGPYPLEGPQQALFGIHNQEIVDLVANNKIKSIIIKSQKDLETHCIKNHQYTFLKTFNLLKVVEDALKNNSSGFSKIKNPYFEDSNASVWFKK